MKAARVALLGLTHPHSRAHLKSLQRSAQVSQIVLYDEDADEVANVRAELGEKVEASYSNLDELLDGEDLLMGLVCLRNDLNARICLRLIDAGLHVLSEKPMAARSQDLEQIVKAGAQAEVKVGVIYQNRFHPISQEARRLIQEGVIGRVTGCETRMVTSQVRYRNPEHWLFSRQHAGGGILSWLGCHHLDLLRYISNDEVVAVSAMVATLGGEGIDVEDVASVVLRFKSGAIGGLQAGYQLALSTSGYSGASYDTYLGFRGTEGRIYWRPSEAPLRLYVESAMPTWASASQRITSFTLPSVPGYGGAYGLAFLEAFIRAALRNEEPPATAEDALKVARIVEAAYESSRTGRTVTV